MSFDLEHFWRFCRQINVNTKELGVIKLSSPFGTQRWFMRCVAEGLAADVHNFTVLKCRQIGLSTISLALDLYWVFKHAGLDGTLVVQDESSLNSFRTQLEEYYRQLPRTWKPAKKSHNRTEFVFKHPGSGAVSRLQYQIAGTKQRGGGGLGRAKGNAFLHATEMSSWGDQEGLMSLRASLAEMNPRRLYIWESTARGFNGFYDLWNEAQRAVSQRGIFVSWWAHELYRIPRDDVRFRIYWGESGKPTGEERRLARDVALLYGDALEFVNGHREIQPEQLAWYRWYSEEKVADPEILLQEMPWTEHQAFIVTGQQYYTGRSLAEAYKRIEQEPPPEYYRVEVRHSMIDTHILSVPKKVANLYVWEAPQAGATYVLGADPAYGSSDWADRFVVSVWRAYADRLDQVAEFCSPDFMPYSFAWVMCYLAGAYAPCSWNLEVNGPGAAVLQEIDNLKRQTWAGAAKDRQTLKNFVGGMREFFYSRIDSIGRTPTARGTKSTFGEKNRYMDSFHDYFERGMAVPHSHALIDEMKGIVRGGDNDASAPAATGRNKDDRVIAAALACQMWVDKLRTPLMAKGVTYTRTSKEAGRQMSVQEVMQQRYARLLGFRAPPEKPTAPPREQGVLP